MKIVLLEDVSNLGLAGDLVTVKDGYGRNFLIPSGKAGLANDRNIKMLEHQKKVAAKKAEGLLKNHRAFALRINKLELVAKVNVGEEDRMFGAVTNSDIAELMAAAGVEVDKRIVILDEPIKALGVYTVAVKIHPEVEAHVKVKVVKAE